MNNDTGVDRLHAFVDGQLDTADKARLLEETERDPALRAQICELQRLKEYVSVAFESVPAKPPSSRYPWPRKIWGQGIAALLLLGVGFLTGYGMKPANGPVVTDEAPHIVLHVNSADSEKLLKALAGAETLAEGAQVEVVANAGGLDLLRSDRSPVVSELRRVMAKYPNIHFVACNVTIDNRRWLGEDPVLIQGIEVAPSAAEHILRRMEEGWSYLRV